MSEVGTLTTYGVDIESGESIFSIDHGWGSYSPKGDKIIFGSLLADKGGTILQRITALNSAGLVRWSSDGNKLAYLNSEKEDDRKLSVFNLENQRAENIVPVFLLKRWNGRQTINTFCIPLASKPERIYF